MQEDGMGRKEAAQGDSDDGESDDELEGADEEPDQSAGTEGEKGWDLSKLRSNMFAFLDGDGNVVYETVEEKKVSDATDDESEEEETKEEDEEERKSDRTDRRARPRGSGKASPPPETADASSAMAVNPQTKLPEAVVRAEPLPRINAKLSVSGHNLLLYGGLVEVGEREVTLDDFWRLDLKKREGWECLFPGTMHKQKWRGASRDDEDSCVSAGDGENPEEEGEASSDEDRGLPKGARDNIEEGDYRFSGGDAALCPLEGEALTDYYKRTVSYWTLKASSAFGDASDQAQSEKELKREAFHLAQNRFSESKPVQERIRDLVLGPSHEK
jgi:hypothetical protein